MATTAAGSGSGSSIGSAASMFNTVIGIGSKGIKEINSSLQNYTDVLRSSSQNLQSTTGRVKKAMAGSRSINTFKQMEVSIAEEIVRCARKIEEFQNVLQSTLANYEKADQNNTVFTNVSKKVSSK